MWQHKLHKTTTTSMDHNPQGSRAKAVKPPQPSALLFFSHYFSFKLAHLYTLSFSSHLLSTHFSLWDCDCASTLFFFNLLFLVLSILKSSNQSFSGCSILHCSALSDKILSFLEEWGIEKKIFSITLDNSSNNDNCQNFLKKKLNEGGLLLCDGILRKPITCYFAGLLVLFVLRSISFWSCKLVIICILTMNY